MNAFSRNFSFFCCFRWSILSEFSFWRAPVPNAGSPHLRAMPLPATAQCLAKPETIHPTTADTLFPKKMRIQHCFWLFHLTGKSKHLKFQKYLNGWVAWRVRTRIVLLSSHRHKTISARDLNRNLSIVCLFTQEKNMYQFRLPNVIELVALFLCILVEKLVMTFLGRLQVTNAHLNLKRKAASHQFSMPDYIKTQVRHC